LALARPAAADPDEAERLKAAAEQAVRAGDAVKAVYYLRRAYEAHPDPGLIANLGLVYERLGQYGDAADSFERYLASDPPEAKRIAAEAALARLRPEGVITSTPPGATVQLDDAPESVGNTPLRLRLTAGAHAARLTYFGYAPADAPIEQEAHVLAPEMRYIGIGAAGGPLPGNGAPRQLIVYIVVESLPGDG
ncbi:MAG: PEGA domain-containing protein, partial [Myxococcales bacterium]|nr:PEGA domain-containing protein [Myxococcales bacterium]